ncbi:SDR family NAD(P)-dependent oxidoreductase, partial [Staphylococcus epidermidis]|uniref:SDR family NAD(P)-dependent oxidoreductase n=1 Tax=Staphylococcus epidermidis TaxID=1282 RepID=UPI0011A5475F
PLLLQTHKQFKQKPYQPLPFNTHLSKNKQHQQLLQFPLTQFPQLHLMVNNPPLHPLTPILQIPQHQLSNLFNINLFPTFFPIQPPPNQFIKQKTKPKIINPSSIP